MLNSLPLFSDEKTMVLSAQRMACAMTSGAIVSSDIGNELMKKLGIGIFCEEGIMTRERISVLFFVLFAIAGPAFGIDRLVPFLPEQFMVLGLLCWALGNFIRRQVF